MKVLLIIPAYNEEESIENTILDIKNNTNDVDFIVINDCSTDNTVQVLQSLGVDYLDLPANLGIGGCVQTGYLYALENHYDIAIQFDGDGQHDAKYISDLIEPIANNEADIVIGSRFIDKEGFQSSAMRRFGIKFLSGFIKLLSRENVKDITSGFRATNKEMIALYAENYAQDYPEPEAILCAGLNGARIKEVPVTMRERQFGNSSIKPLKGAYYMIKVSCALIVDRITMRRVKK